MRKPITIILLALFLISFTVNSSAQGCARSKPIVTLSPTTVSGPGDTTYLLTLTIKNDDTQACGSTGFNITASLPQGWSSFIRTSPISIFPQQSEVVTIDVRVPKNVAQQQHQAIIVVDSPNHATPNLKTSATALITIRDEPKTCSISVDSITFRTSSTDVEKTTFCLKEKVDVDTKISLRGNVQSEVFTDLFVNGKLLDSSKVNIYPDNFATINFKNSIDTQAFGKSTVNMKVTAKAQCATSESTREKQFTIDICDPSCLFTTSIAAPLEKQVGQDVTTSIYTRNIGNKENLIAIEQAVCKGDCTPMVCEISSIKLQPQESKSYSCRQKVKETGTHTIETKLFSCGKEETQTKSFMGVEAKDEMPTAGECKVEPLAEFRCSGSIRQQLYRNSDCSTTWVYSQYCPDGCSNGLCISTGEEVRGFEPILTLGESFEGGSGKDISLAFDLENTINSPAKFDVKVDGKVADWIYVPSPIIVDGKSREQISFSAAIPEGVKPGEYEFTITVSTGTRNTSKSSSIKIAEEKTSIPIDVIIVAGFLSVIFMIILLRQNSKRKQAF